MKTIVFDLDGTLIDSLPDVQVALNHGLDQFGYPSLSVNSVKRMVGGGALSLVESALASFGGDQNHAASISTEFKSYYSAHPVVKTTIYPFVIEALEILNGQGFKLGICTNKPEATTYPVLKKLDLERYFASIICGDSLAYKKPDRRHLLDVVTEIGGTGETSVYVGDSETDVETAKTAGVPIILMSYGYAHKPVNDLAADVVLDVFSEVPGSVEALLSTRGS